MAAAIRAATAPALHVQAQPSSLRPSSALPPAGRASSSSSSSAHGRASVASLLCAAAVVQKGHRSSRHKRFTHIRAVKEATDIHVGASVKVVGDDISFWHMPGQKGKPANPAGLEGVVVSIIQDEHLTPNRPITVKLTKAASETTGKFKAFNAHFSADELGLCEVEEDVDKIGSDASSGQSTASKVVVAEKQEARLKAAKDEEEASRKAEAARKQAQARQRELDEEAARKKAEEDEAREKEAARTKAEKEAKELAAAEEKRKKEEEDAARRKAAEEDKEDAKSDDLGFDLYEKAPASSMITEDERWAINLLYDSDCPSCMKQVEFLRKRMDENPEYEGLVLLTDLQSPDYDPEAHCGIVFKDGMRHIHAITREGEVITGMDVFRRIYSIVGMQWVYDVTTLPVVGAFFDGLYDWFSEYRLRWAGREDILESVHNHQLKIKELSETECEVECEVDWDNLAYTTSTSSPVRP